MTLLTGTPRHDLRAGVVRHNERVEEIGSCPGCWGEPPLALGEHDLYVTQVLAARELKSAEQAADATQRLLVATSVSFNVPTFVSGLGGITVA